MVAYVSILISSLEGGWSVSDNVLNPFPDIEIPVSIHRIRKMLSSFFKYFIAVFLLSSSFVLHHSTNWGIMQEK